MIITRIAGGLGNQMFQYAIGRVLASRHATEHLLDTRLFNRYDMHNGFELKRVFDIPARVATEDEIKSLIGWKASRWSQKLLSYDSWAWLRGGNYFLQTRPSYMKEVHNVSSHCYLSGYWQTEKYFKGFERQLAKDFTFTRPLTDDVNIDHLNLIQSTNAISVHIRRGDYVNHPVHGTCSPDYYRRAFRYIGAHVKAPFFFLFSDDPDYVRENFGARDDCHIVLNNTGDKSHIDMRLMSKCNHHIVANSSFSWWGAWLGSNPSKIVVAPEKWFRMDRRNSNDRVPEAWLRIPSEPAPEVSS